MGADPFEALAEEVVRKAEKVRCDLQTFARGLRTIVEAVRERGELADDEVWVRERKGDDDGT